MEEIMDFQWFEHVTWDSIKDLRGTTYVQTRFKFALQQDMPSFELSFTTTQPLRPQNHDSAGSSESNCAHFLDARLELFWAEDWSALWA